MNLISFFTDNHRYWRFSTAPFTVVPLTKPHTSDLAMRYYNTYKYAKVKVLSIRSDRSRSRGVALIYTMYT